MSQPITLAFVDDHPVLLEGMTALFSYEPRYKVVAKGSSADDAMNLVREHHPDLLFMDLSMPGDVFSAISEIAERHPDTRVVVFTAFSSVDSALRALDAGATGFVLKGGRMDEVLEAAEVVLRGEMYITKQYAGQVLSGLRNKARRDELARAVRLSVREKQIVGHLLQARTNREIASNLSISEKTVKYYMSTLMTKLNARNRVEVVIAAQRNASLD